jgi:hypothetical protein
MDITGKVIVVLPPREGVSQSSGNPWKSQDYVIETQEIYPKKICFNVFGAEKIQEMNIQLGEMITVSIEINANEYNGKWYNQVRGWQVSRVQATQPQQAVQQPQGCQPYYPNQQPPQQPYYPNQPQYPQQGYAPQQPQYPPQQQAPVSTAPGSEGLPF